jgi:hypothetical protein
MLLQNLVEVEGTPITGRKSVYPSLIVLPDSLDSVALASRSTHALPRAHSEASRPSSRATMTPSLLSSPLSRARSCSHSSTTTACEGDGALHQSKGRNRRHNKEASPGKCWHKVKTHLTDGNAGLEEASVLARCGSDWWQSQRELPPQ